MDAEKSRPYFFGDIGEYESETVGNRGRVSSAGLAPAAVILVLELAGNDGCHVITQNYSPGKRDDDVRDTFAAAHMGLSGPARAHTEQWHAVKNENNLAY